jgi:hypothetical protein
LQLDVSDEAKQRSKKALGEDFNEQGYNDNDYDDNDNIGGS